MTENFKKLQRELTKVNDLGADMLKEMSADLAANALIKLTVDVRNIREKHDSVTEHLR